MFLYATTPRLCVQRACAALPSLFYSLTPLRDSFRARPEIHSAFIAAFAGHAPPHFLRSIVLRTLKSMVTPLSRLRVRRSFFCRVARAHRMPH